MNKLSFLSFFSMVMTISVLNIGLVSCAPASSGLQDKCAPEFTKLGECLAYATAKADTPTETCCSSVSGIRQRNAMCLCFIIQQAHQGNSAASSLGLQLERLIKLPSACKLPDTNITECPKLLNLSPSSPDYAMFTNPSKAATTPPTTATPSGSSSSGNVKSQGIMNMAQLRRILTAALSSALCLSFF